MDLFVCEVNGFAFLKVKFSWPIVIITDAFAL